MLWIFTAIKQKLFPDPQPSASPEELRAAFTKRYSHFRSLLTANNNALQAMAELEKVYYSGESYRMAFVRSKISAILINVYKMIRDILAMSDGKYKELEPIFEKISNDINDIVERKQDFQQGPFILELSEVRKKDKDQVGEKMANLGEISSLPGIVTPPGFVVTASATRHFLTPNHIAEINRLLQVLDPDNLEDLYKSCEDMQKIVMNTPCRRILKNRCTFISIDLKRRVIPVAKWPYVQVLLVKIRPVSLLPVCIVPFFMSTRA